MSALVLGVALFLASGPALGADAPSTTEQIFIDYSRDDVIDGTYTASELQAAIDASRSQGSSFEEFELAVQEVFDTRIGGIKNGSRGGSGAEDTTNGLIPRPRLPGERDQPPWPFLAMTALGAMLVLTGAGSSIYRRVHR